MLPALIRKFHEAKMRGDQQRHLWGTGAPRREFLYSDDMAAACVHLLALPAERLAGLVNDRSRRSINVGSGVDLTIRELAEQIRRIVGTEATVKWDSSKLDGTPRKLLTSAGSPRSGGGRRSHWTTASGAPTRTSCV